MRLACRELPGWFAQTATIVTPSAFLAGVAREQFSNERLKKNLESWERPPIHGLEAWLVSCWQEARYSLNDPHTLLSPSQERALWHDTIEQEHPQLFDVSATVRLAQAAARLIAEWHIATDGEAWSDHADAQQFQRWFRTFRQRCRENKWITRADLPRLVSGLFTSGQLAPQATAFVGFENNSPALENVLSALGAKGVRLPLDHAKPAKKVPAKGFDALPEEIEYAARRLRSLFEENQNRSLALFVPELAKNSSLVERTLKAVFYPSAATKLADISETLFRFSAAGLLIDEPLVAAALLLLSITGSRIDHSDAGAILRCPFIKGAHAEQSVRALADIKLRKQRELDVSFRDIEIASHSCPLLTACWQKVGKLLPKTLQRRTFSEWSEFISDMLAALGWPGDKALTAREERITDRWKDQLSELSSLGLVMPSLTFESALGQLRRLLSVRAERGEWSSPIQVLDSSQAHGVECDSALIVGLSEETWPPALRASPLIPPKLQRKYNVPGNLREDRVRQTQALFETSPDLLVTFSGQITSLAVGLVAKKSKDVSLWEGDLPTDSFEPAELEQQRDGKAPPFIAAGELRGGTGVIKAQSQCPFQAFAKYRLHASRPEDASFGFDALNRGTFVHKSLELVWGRLRSLQNLLHMPKAELEELVRNSISEAVTTKDSGPLHQLSVATERERLQELILDWLEVERCRQQNFTVETIEEKQKFEVPGLSLALRVDRIDRLDNGNLVLIDYKSGAQSRPKLAGERPAEPQLLVYAAAANSDVDGMFFGQLKQRDVKAVGYSRTKQFGGRAVEVKKEWERYIKDSHDTVHKLASEFVRGVAEVRPTGSPCEFCGMKPFCRVNEKGVTAEDDE